MMDFKRILFFLGVVALVGYATQAHAARFTDANGSGYDTAIHALADAGIINGYPDGSVQPFHTLNRAEALKIILGSQAHTASHVQKVARTLPPLPLFQDIDQKAWYAPYVEAGFELKIVKGYPDGRFRPGNTLTVEEAIALLMRAYGEEASVTQFQTSVQLQNRQGEWFTSSINAALRRNLVGSREKLVLGNPVTRGQFFDMVYRMREVQRRQIVAYAESAQDRQPVAGAPVSHASAIPADVAQYASRKPFAITLPSLGIRDLSIIHPDDPFTSKGVLSVLDRGVGHLFSYPGEGGKIMVYGHSSGYPWDISEYTKIFRRINELKPGDRAYVTYGGKLHIYEVTRHQTIKEDDIRPFEPDGTGEELILYTCWPPDSVDLRYLVHLKPIQVISL